MCKKKILVVGANSYIGTSFEKWLLKNYNKYQIDTIGTLKEEWKEISFSQYDSILHVAGIAHVSADPKKETLYYKINRDLAIEVCKKAKLEGVSQFVFMSSIIIYGKDGVIGENRIITDNTEYTPIDFYGRSKLEADLAIQGMEEGNFKPVIIRTPVVYGPGCKGNFPKLIRLAKYMPLFFNIENEKSMIFIDNLCEFLRLVIDKEVKGVFYPQNKEYVSTTNIIKIAAKKMNRKVYLTNIFNGLLRVLALRIDLLNKIFGNKVYEKLLSDEFNWEYCVIDFEKSVEETARGKR